MSSCEEHVVLHRAHYPCQETQRRNCARDAAASESASTSSARRLLSLQASVRTGTSARKKRSTSVKRDSSAVASGSGAPRMSTVAPRNASGIRRNRSEEHTSELQSRL